MYFPIFFYFSVWNVMVCESQAGFLAGLFILFSKMNDIIHAFLKKTVEKPQSKWK